MNDAAQEMLSTLFNEIENNDWTFGGAAVELVTLDPDRHHIHVALGDSAGHVLTIAVEERGVAVNRMCQNCQQVKPGWPETWRNIGGKRTIYGCADCAAAKENVNEPKQ